MHFLRTSFLTLLASSTLCLHAYASPWSHNFYAGVGGGWQHQTWNSHVSGMYINFQPTGTVNFNSSLNNGFGNAFVGLANTDGDLYLALEGDVYYSNKNTNQYYSEPYQGGLPVSSDTLNTRMPWRYELDFIVGNFFTPKFLGYVKVGATTGQLQTQLNTYDSNNQQIGDSPTMKTWAYGGVLGLGAQYSLTRHWRLGAEADYLEFARVNSSTNSSYFNGAIPTTLNASSQPKGYLLKATLSYLF